MPMTSRSMTWSSTAPFTRRIEPHTLGPILTKSRVGHPNGRHPLDHTKQRPYPHRRHHGTERHLQQERSPGLQSSASLTLEKAYLHRGVTTNTPAPAADASNSSDLKIEVAFISPKGSSPCKNPVKYSAAVCPSSSMTAMHQTPVSLPS